MADSGTDSCEERWPFHPAPNLVGGTPRPDLVGVGERVRLVGGMLAGSIEGTVSSLGLFDTTLVRGEDRLLIPNNVLIQLAVVPLREPDRVDVTARFGHEASPRRVEERLLRSIRVPTRHPPMWRSRNWTKTASCCESAPLR